MRSTIYALATGPGRSAIAVVRISGPESADALLALSGRRLKPRRASLVRLTDPRSHTPLDRAMALWMPGPQSYSGEDQVELHLHGGRSVVEATLGALDHIGLRLAEAGEFTRRAFENGRMALSEAEAVADLIDAETDAQRQQAIAQLDGALGRMQEHWRSDLLDAAALLEAAIDFPDEDLPQDLLQSAREPLERLHSELSAAASDTRGERVREGYRIALIGAPNAGKSSLLNALIGRDAAIVTAVPGTTRDVIEAHADIAGFKVLIADMAGLRATTDPIESEGVRRARSWAQTADLRLLLVDHSADGEHWSAAADLVQAGDLIIMSKADLKAGSADRSARVWAEEEQLTTLECSTFNNQVAELNNALHQRIVTVFAKTEAPIATRMRHRQMMELAAWHVQRALAGVQKPELIAEDIRLAATALERLSGRIDPDHVLDRVFGSFCIGK